MAHLCGNKLAETQRDRTTQRGFHVYNNEIVVIDYDLARGLAVVFQRRFHSFLITRITRSSEWDSALFCHHPLVDDG